MTKPKKSIQFPASVKALAVYKKRRVELDAAWAKVETKEDVEDLLRLQEIEAMKIRRAFFEDTKHINSLSGCMAISIEDVEKIVVKANADAKGNQS